MTPSRMPAGPDAQHMLDPSSKSVSLLLASLVQFMDIFVLTRFVVLKMSALVEQNCVCHFDGARSTS